MVEARHWFDSNRSIALSCPGPLHQGGANDVPACDPNHNLCRAGGADAPLQCLQHAQGRARTNKLNQTDTLNTAANRRTPADRRKRTFRSLLQGSLSPRRRGPRRDTDRSITAVDWHHPQWLAVAMLTLLLCTADALLTLTLLERGANEANPFMEPLVGGSALVFAMVKMGLTSGGIIVLILLARMRVFGRVPVSFILYMVLVAYTALVGYELWLLETLFATHY
jgi:hypothetical protein